MKRISEIVRRYAVVRGLVFEKLTPQEGMREADELDDKARFFLAQAENLECVAASIRQRAVNTSNLAAEWRREAAEAMARAAHR